MTVIAPHRHPDPLLVRFAIASAVVHLIALGWIRTMQHRPTRPPAMLIELAAPRPSAESTPAAMPHPAARPAAPAKPKPVATPPRPQQKASKPAPAKKEKPVAQAKPRPKPKPAPTKATPQPTPAAKATDRQPAAESAAKPDAEETASPGQTLDDIRKLLQQKGSGTANSGHALPQGIQGRLYFNQLVAAIRAAWSVPPSAGQEPVEVDVRIDAQGRVLDAQLRKSSGDSLLDRSALRAIRQADIPAPPADFRTPLQLTFRLIPPEG